MQGELWADGGHRGPGAASKRDPPCGEGRGPAAHAAGGGVCMSAGPGEPASCCRPPVLATRGCIWPCAAPCCRAVAAAAVESTTRAARAALQADTAGAVVSPPAPAEQQQHCTGESASPGWLWLLVALLQLHRPSNQCSPCRTSGCEQGAWQHWALRLLPLLLGDQLPACCW